MQASLRVRTSTVEQFRRCIETEYASSQELADYLKAGQTSEPNTNMKVGTAFHAVLENPDGTEFIVETENKRRGGATVLHKHHRSGDYYFDGPTVRQAVAMIGPGRKEVEFVRKCATPYGEIDLKGTVDWVRGLVVQDTKTKIE